jgi:signal transduction histidine kinase
VRTASRLVVVTDAALVVTTIGFLLVDLLFAVLLSMQGAHVGRWGVLSPFAPLVVGVLAVVAVARRRSLLVPMAALLVAVAALTGGLGVVMDLEWTPSFAALFALAVLTARAIAVERAVTAVAVSVGAAVAVGALATVPMATNPVPVIVLAEVGFAGAVGIGLYQRWSLWRRATAEAAARTDERLAIARELHDTIGHYVTGIVVQAQAARHVSARDPEAAEAALARIETAGSDALDAMRQVVAGLRTGAATAPGDTWADVDALVAGAREQGMPLVAHIDPGARRQAGPLAAATHRIVAESLTNVRKHGRDVTAVTVEVIASGSATVVRVRDDGTLRSLPGHSAFGIVGMRERAEALGGTLYAGPADGDGWLVQAELPWPAPS